jgi:hypothetical protein
MALIATMYQGGEPRTTVRTGDDGIAVFSEPRYGRVLGLINEPGSSDPAKGIFSVDLGRHVSVIDGDFFLLALPDAFRTSGQGTSFDLSDDELTDEDDAIEDIIWKLRAERVPAPQALHRLPRKPGLYAIWGDDVAWADLGLSPGDGTRPLYVGKAKGSLRDRDGGAHFRIGKTGSSTVRRSVAALLHERQPMHAQPRNTAKPANFANFGLERESDATVQAWIEQHLSIGTWTWNENDPLEVLERRVIRWRGWQDGPPPLNLTNLGGASSDTTLRRVRAAREVLAEQARRWRPPTD